MAIDTSPTVWDHAVRVFGSVGRARKWMNTSLPELGGQTPDAVLDENPKAVEEILDRIEDGVFG
jgi:uncharacterized protein (DUF2384 family)